MSIARKAGTSTLVAANEYMPTLDSAIRPHFAVVSLRSAEGIALFHPVYQADYLLNSRGAEIWDYIHLGWSLRDISLRLQEESAGDTESVDRELQQFISMLYGLRLVRIWGARAQLDPSLPNTNGPRIRIAALRFISQALSPHDNREVLTTLLDRVASGRLPWQLVRNVANHYRMSSTLFVALRAKGLFSGLPEELRNHLSESYESVKSSNLILREQATEIIKKLNSSGIEPILLKGIAYLFSKPTKDLQIRQMADIDLMVPKEAMGTAIQILTTIGYSKIRSSGIDYDQHHHCAPMVRKRKEAPVELHSEPVARSLSPLLPTEQVWQNSLLLEDKDIAVRVLNPTHQVLLNVLHSELSHERYLYGLISLRDLHEFTWICKSHAKELNLRIISDIMKRHGEEKVLKAYFHLAYWLFGMPLTNEIRLNYRSAFHRFLCQAIVQWPLFAKGAHTVQFFSAETMRRRYSYSDTRWALTAARFRYLWFLARRGMKRLK